MKKILLFTLVCLFSISLYAQDKTKKQFEYPRFALTLSGGIGGSYASAFEYYEDDYFDDYWYDDDMYRNNKLSYEVSLGAQFYILRWLYIKTGISYIHMENRYEQWVIDDALFNDPKLELDGLAIPFSAGFTFLNKSRFYPMIEVGLLPFFSFNNDFTDSHFRLGTTVKLGGGVNITKNFGLELAFNTNQFYQWEHKRHRGHYNDYYKVSGGVLATAGISLGVSVKF